MPLLATSCRDVGSAPDMFAVEQAFREQTRDASQIVEGEVLDPGGKPVVGARVSIGTLETRTGEDGRYRLANVPQRNALMEVSGRGYRPELLPLVLESPSPTIPQIVLHPRAGGTVRMLFAGDTGFGRRFLDPSEKTPRNAMPRSGLPGLIDTSDPLPGTKYVLGGVRPFFQIAEWAALNFESPVTARPDTPHQTKDYVFFTLPGSLPALRWLGVDWVGLGNNHTYDYLEPGLRDTLTALKQERIPYNGAGLNQAQALEPYRVQLAGTSYSLVAGTSITGDEHPVTYVATATKPGAMDLTDQKGWASRIRQERGADQVPIAFFHGGDEYTYRPTPFFRNRLTQAVDSGAALVIAHHPHVLQGVERYRGRLIVHSLGNFAFDQDRLETMLSALAWVDMREDRAERLRFTPIYLDDFRPRPIGGALADRLIRRMAESSQPYGMLVYPFAGQGWVSLEDGDTIASTRSITVEVTIGQKGANIVDLRRLASSDESLSGVDAPARLGLQLGRDILFFGDFESWDVPAITDQPGPEANRWNFVGGGGQVCRHRRLAGAASACLAPSARFAFKNRARVWGDALDQPNKDLSVLGYVATSAAGPLDLLVTYQASEKEAEFGGQRFRLSAGGTSGWRQFWGNLAMPADVTSEPAPERNPRALRLFVEHGAANRVEAAAYVDELAVINWDPVAPAAQLAAIPAPHPKDFLRVRGAPGRHRLTLRFRSFVPAAASRARSQGASKG